MKQNRKSIKSNQYTKKYFLTDCDGYHIFQKSQGRELPERLKSFYQRLILYSQDKVLELGCGRGELAKAIAPHVHLIIGTDYSKAAIKLCRETYKNNILKNLKFMLANVKNLPFPDNSFDLVYCTELLEHLYDWELKKMMMEVVRVLQPEGRFIAQTEPNRLYWLASSFWSFLPRFFEAVKKKQKIHFQIERPTSHLKFHLNELTYWSAQHLAKDYFKEYKIETQEMILGMNKWERLIFNAYPLKNLPLLKLLFNREIILFCQQPKKERE